MTLDPRAVEQAVANAGRSSVDPRETQLGGPVDLSADAIAARAAAGGGGLTGRQLYQNARRVFERAQTLRKRRRPAALRKAGEALQTAAVQIRLAQMTPLDRGYLHALDLPRIQTVQAEVGRAFANDPAALAVDTHRRIRDQRLRIAAETGAS